MLYKEAEAALTVVFVVPPEKMGAFRARIRHLRNLGVPAIPKPGSGQKVDYSRDHLIHLALALELEQAGLSPIDAAKFSGQIVRNTLKDRAVTRNKAFFVSVTYDQLVTGKGGNGLTPAEIVEGIKLLKSVTIVNVALMIRSVDDELSSLGVS